MRYPKKGVIQGVVHQEDLRGEMPRKILRTGRKSQFFVQFAKEGVFHPAEEGRNRIEGGKREQSACCRKFEGSRDGKEEELGDSPLSSAKKKKKSRLKPARRRRKDERVLLQRRGEGSPQRRKKLVANEKTGRRKGASFDP